MIRNRLKKIGLLLLISMQLIYFIVPSANAITLDGVVNEPTWDLWFTDTENPSYEMYYSSDDSNVYLGVLTSNTNLGTSHFQIAFRGNKDDWAIMYSDISGIKYLKSKDNPSGYYWESSKTGVPEGIQIVQGVTEGKISYEIIITNELLGKNAIDFPDNFRMWIMYSTPGDGKWIWSVVDLSEGEVNFYPDSRADWWFVYSVEDDKFEVLNEPPQFHAPELPLGTVLSLAIMLSAILLVSKRKPINSF